MKKSPKKNIIISILQSTDSDLLFITEQGINLVICMLYVLHIKRKK